MEPGSTPAALFALSLLGEDLASGQWSEAVDFIGASLDTGADTDFAVLNLTVLSKDLDNGLDLLGDVLLHPSFPDAEVMRRREAALASLQEEEDEPGRVPFRVLIGGAGILGPKWIEEHDVLNAHPGRIPAIRGLDAGNLLAQ